MVAQIVGGGYHVRASGPNASQRAADMAAEIEAAESARGRPADRGRRHVDAHVPVGCGIRRSAVGAPDFSVAVRRVPVWQRRLFGLREYRIDLRWGDLLERSVVLHADGGGFAFSDDLIRVEALRHADGFVVRCSYSRDA